MPDPTTATDAEIRDALRPYLQRAFDRGNVKADKHGKFSLRLRKD
jgi:hypothetical protein